LEFLDNCLLFFEHKISLRWGAFLSIFELIFWIVFYFYNKVELGKCLRFSTLRLIPITFTTVGYEKCRHEERIKSDISGLSWLIIHSDGLAKLLLKTWEVRRVTKFGLIANSKILYYWECKIQSFTPMQPYRTKNSPPPIVLTWCFIVLAINFITANKAETTHTFLVSKHNCFFRTPPHPLIANDYHPSLSSIAVVPQSIWNSRPTFYQKVITRDIFPQFL